MGGSRGGGGPAPVYYAPPAPAPVDTTVADQAKAKEESKKRRVGAQATGRASTILTSGLGVTAGNQTLGA